MDALVSDTPWGRAQWAYVMGLASAANWGDGFEGEGLEGEGSKATPTPTRSRAFVRWFDPRPPIGFVIFDAWRNARYRTTPTRTSSRVSRRAGPSVRSRKHRRFARGNDAWR